MKAHWVVLCAMAAHAQDLAPLLSRLSEEADVYRRMAPQAITQETLHQRIAVFAPDGSVRLRTREIVSEYGIGAFKDAPDQPHEFRQVLSVNGREVLKPARARRSLSLGLSSADDRLRKRMLEDFQAHGLTGAAVDFGPLILLFTKRNIGKYRFAQAGVERVGPDEAVVLAYTQAAGSETVTVFSGRKVFRQPLEGRIVLRKADGLPLRITLVAARSEAGRRFVEEGTVDYVLTGHGFLAPASVVHRSYAGGRLVAENRFHYAAFRKFSADAEIKFTEVPEVH